MTGSKSELSPPSDLRQTAPMPALYQSTVRVVGVQDYLMHFPLCAIDA